jgi:hypothetical protein
VKQREHRNASIVDGSQIPEPSGPQAGSSRHDNLPPNPADSTKSTALTTRGSAGIDRSIWLISGIVLAGIGFTGSMVLFTTVTQKSSWELDIAFGLMFLGFAGLVLGVLAIFGWGPFGYVRLNPEGNAGQGEEGRADDGRVDGRVLRDGDGGESLEGEGQGSK